MNSEWLSALFGGLIIGVAVSLMMLWNGRITGISGIVNGALSNVKGDTAWRLLFIMGLIVGGFLIGQFKPNAFQSELVISDWSVVLAGLLVGFGTIMGSGCTSGHGVCGISRLSPRSIVSTSIFMAAGIAFVFLFKKLGVYL